MISKPNGNFGFDTVGELVKNVYAENLWHPLSDLLFDRLGFPLLTRQEIHHASPEYVLNFEWVDSPERISVTPPQSVGTVPERFFEVVREWTLTRPFVCIFADIDLVGPVALPVAPDGSIVLEAVEGSPRIATNALVKTVMNGSAPVHRGNGNDQTAVVPMAGPWSDNFFHWFADYLPRIRTLRQYELESDTEIRFVIPSDPPEWLTDSLTAVDVPPERRTQWSGERTSVDRLIVPSLPRETHTTVPPQGIIHSMRGIEWVRERLLEGVAAADPPNFGDRLYVSRSRQSARRVRNEDELRAVAQLYGFETIHAEDWSLAEQIAVFSKADAVLGPHGAGLINAIYGEETTLIELFGNRTNTCYFRIAEGLGLSYAMLQCESVWNDLVVDPNRLEELLSFALEE